MLIEHSQQDAARLVNHLHGVGYAVEPERVDTEEAFDTALRCTRWDVVISDDAVPHFGSMDALALMRTHAIDCPFIIVSATMREDAAVAAMRSGAHDFVRKNDLTRLGPTIERAVADAAVRRQMREERDARRHVELQLQHAQKMEAVGRMAGGIAHDFNNLLTAILGFAGLALDKLAEGRDVTDELEQVHEAAQRAGRLTRQLLAFSRQQALAAHVFDPVEAIHALLPLLGRLMGEDVSIETSGDRGVLRVKTDPGQFEQVLMNLAVNARDAMPRGGTFRLSAAVVELDASDSARLQVVPGRYVRITAADTGHGMDHTTRARIFEPFFTTKQSGEGTGLGLSMVNGIVTRSGGGIDVRSEIGKGTAFDVFLPLVDQWIAAPSPEARESTRRQFGKVLVAEDETAVRRVLRQVLTAAGFDVLEAASGHEAAGLVDSLADPVDVLVTDVVMPGMTGPDLAQHVIARFPDVRVLYITGYASHSAIPPGLLQQNDALLQKPFLPDELLARVHRLGHR